MTHLTIKRKPIYTHYLFSGLYQAHTEHLPKRSESRCSKGAWHVWGYSEKFLGLIAGISFHRVTPSPYCLFLNSLPVFLPFVSVWKRKGNGCYAGYHSSGENCRKLEAKTQNVKNTLSSSERGSDLFIYFYSFYFYLFYGSICGNCHLLENAVGPEPFPTLGNFSSIPSPPP